MQETLDAIIGEHQSEVVKDRKILHSFYYFWLNWYVKKKQ